MAERMEGRRHIAVSTIPLHVRGGEVEGDWVSIAVLVSKSQPKTSQKGSQYSIWQLSDLSDCTKTVGLFLFSSAHSSLWKTAVGTVVGVLNAQIMKDREGSQSSNLVTLSIYDAMRVMVMGTARDLGWCRGKTKAGGVCRQFVNKNTCEFCIYHIQREYQKSSSKRADIQSSYSRAGPRGGTSLKQKVLGKDQIFYGGQMYSGGGASGSDSPVVLGKQSSSKKSKDLATLGSLKLQLKSKQLRDEDGKKAVVLNHLSEEEIKQLRDIGKDNEALCSRLMAPTFGARNLLRHKAKEEQNSQDADKRSKGIAVSLSAKDLLKMTQRHMSEQRKQQQDRVSNNSGIPLSGSPKSVPPPSRPSLSNVPQLGRGLKPGQDLSFDLSPQEKKVPFDAAKAKALAILKNKGETLKSGNKNDVRNKHKTVEPEFQEKVQKRLRESSSKEDDTNSPASKRTKLDGAPRSLLGNLDLNDDKIKAMIEKKSRHGNLVTAEEDAILEKYYMKLEQKEMLEDKMSSIMAVPVSAVVCKVCKYQAIMQSQFCKDEGHVVKSVKASKRFFECSRCKRRTVCLEKMPVKACSNCHGGSWTRVAMGKPKKGPRLDTEQLCLRGNEEKYIGSTSGEAFLHVDC